MLTRLKKRWLTPKVLGILMAKLILAGASDLAATTVSNPKTQDTIQSVSLNYSAQLPR